MVHRGVLKIIAHWASVCFSSSIFLSGDSRTQYFSKHLAKTQVQPAGMSTVRNRRQKVIVYAELINEVCQLPSVKKKEKRTQYLHDKYDENQSRAEPPKPISAWSLCRSNVWSMVSKAALRSTSYVHEDYTLWCTCGNTRRLQYTERTHHDGYGWITLPKHLFAGSRITTTKTH